MYLFIYFGKWQNGGTSLGFTQAFYSICLKPKIILPSYNVFYCKLIDV